MTSTHRRLTIALSASLLSAATAAQEIHLHSLVPPGIDEDARFGSSVDLDGTIAVVGASQLDNPATGFFWEGAVFVFDTETRQLLHTLQTPATSHFEDLGRSVAVEDGRIVAGMDSPANQHRAPVFDLATGLEILQLKPVTSGPLQNFGAGVDLAGGIAVVSDPSWRPNFFATPHRGAVWSYDVETGQQLLQFDEAFDSDTRLFGEALATDGNRLVVGAPHSSHGPGANRGIAYLYDLSTGAEIAELLPPGTASGDLFGNSVAVGGGFVAVSAPGSDFPTPDAGRVWVFDAETGSELYSVTGTGSDQNPFFGVTLRISGPFLAVSNTSDLFPSTGLSSVHVFDLATGEELFVLKDAADPPEPFLGSNLAFDGDLLLHGHPYYGQLPDISGPVSYTHLTLPTIYPV